MESVAISLHQITVFSYAASRKTWFTTRELAASTDMAKRTAQLHLLRLVNIGLLERVHTFGGARYHVVEHMNERADAYLARLTEARRAFERKRRSKLGETLTSLAGMMLAL